MSGSLHKKKATQKQNSSRLSNSKITSTYSNLPLSKINCSEIFHHPLPQQKGKPTTRKTTRLKTTRKHQLSVQYILQNRSRQHYSMRSVQIDREKNQREKLEKDKGKTKRKKKERQSNESSRFVVPVFQFSRSNSLIVFSQKDSTINANQHKQKKFFYTKNITPNQAAVLIQKTWRGYLTRKLLEQYINDEESRIVSAINYLKSKEESFVVQEKQSEMQFSDFSSLKQETLQILQKKQIESHDEQQTNAKPYEVFKTQHESNKESPVIMKNFFRNHKTEPSLQNNRQTIIHSSNKKTVSVKLNLTLNSSVFSYSFCAKLKQESIKQYLLNEQLSLKINRIKQYMNAQWKDMKQKLKLKVSTNQIDMKQLLKRNKKLNQIHDNSQQFLGNVLQQLKAMVADMTDIMEQGVNEQQQECPQQNQFQPKSQLFTIQVEENQSEIPPRIKQHFSEGQIKIQSYLHDLIQDYEQNHSETSELQYLCHILKINSERGVKTLVQRCLLQFTVETITSNYAMMELNKIANQISFGQNEQQLFVVKWINELNKWQMGPIQQVTQAMQSSSLINQEPFN